MERKNVEILRHCVLRKNSEVNMFLAQNEGNNHKSVIGTSPNSEGIGALCRICANTNNHLVPIFEGEGSQLGLITKIHKYLPIQVTENDGLPRQLCYQCTVTIIAFHDIAEGCLEAEQKLIQLQQGKKSQKNSEEQQAVVAVEKDETSKKCEEFEAEIQEKQMAIEVSDEKAGGISQETTSVNEETERLSRSEVKQFSRDMQGIKNKRIEIIEAKVTINNKKLFRCKICRKLLSTSYNYLIHMNSHTGEKPYQCKICMKSFSAASALNRHKRLVHSNERNFSCETCEKKFTCKIYLEEHKKTHKEYRPYNCQECDKSFKQKSSLHSHKKCHNSNNFYECKICSKTFPRSQDLKNHNLTHTREKPHACSICGKKFRTKGCVSRHSRTHIEEKNFHCVFCDVKFAQERYLKSHLKIIHKHPK